MQVIAGSKSLNKILQAKFVYTEREKGGALESCPHCDAENNLISVIYEFYEL